ncbi:MULTISPECIES: IS630 family transposase [Caldilinea]|jgi:transposase|uniref:IS630 family transposase n=1 Tax=Caldilinea TaxID=233191 RepID=UPI001E644810|nr:MULTISPECIES: IS630 family transposase [Caldilinea]
MLGAPIGQCENGDGAGTRARVWKTCPGQARRSVFPPEVRAQATALACSLPKEKGVALSRWSLAEIVKRLQALQIAPAISTSTVWRWFQADKLKPWRFHSWQHILDRQKFLERARPILEVYEKAVELLRNGVWAVCVDEKTSIQARQLEQEPVPAKPEQPVHVAPRYKRQGALQLFAGLSVADGYKYGQTSERKRFIDFQAFLLQVIFPEALRRKVHTLILILDNGPTHAPKRLESWLQEQVKLNNWPLTIKVLWLPTHTSWLNQIELWFSVLQRKLLTPNHFNSLTELAQSIMEFIRCENLSPKPIQWSYTVQKLETKLGTVL